MANLLFCWELGAALGHAGGLRTLAPLADELERFV
jgi:hypothetical protein